MGVKFLLRVNSKQNSVFNVASKLCLLEDYI